MTGPGFSTLILVVASNGTVVLFVIDILYIYAYVFAHNAFPGEFKIKLGYDFVMLTSDGGEALPG